MSSVTWQLSTQSNECEFKVSICVLCVCVFIHSVCVCVCVCLTFQWSVFRPIGAGSSCWRDPVVARVDQRLLGTDHRSEPLERISQRLIVHWVSTHVQLLHWPSEYPGTDVSSRRYESTSWVMSDPSSFWSITVLLGIDDIYLQSCISSLFFGFFGQ